MNFEKGYIYHIYNQGNNRQKIFFKQENYIFFLQKTHTHILPYADVLAWCLMPNHFHFMVYVIHESLPVAADQTEGFAPSEAFGSSPKMRTFNFSIGIMLRSYTNAINKQNNSSGALFRRKTKAECVNCSNGITPSFITDSYTMTFTPPEKQYPQVCFNYIHQNPVKAGLVRKTSDWEFSSAADYFGNRNGKLINKKRAEKYLRC